MSKKMHWFCWHHSTVSDPKLRLVASRTGRSVAEVVGTWAVVLECASTAEDRGDVSGLDEELSGLTLGMDARVVADIFEAMSSVKLIVGGRVAHWDDFQNVRTDPTNTARQKRYRKKHPPNNVTKRYVTTQDSTGQDSTELTRQDKAGQRTSCSVKNLEETPGTKQDSATKHTDKGQAKPAGQTLAELDLASSDQAIAICQEARPGADPLDLIRKFEQWGAGKPASNWERSLKTFCLKERLTDEEIRAEQRAIAYCQPPRRPGESAASFAERAADPPLNPEVSAAIGRVLHAL